MNAEDIVPAMVALNGGELVGRTRLQKQAYLLDRCGANLGLRFTYYHYGPYCPDLAGGLHYALAEGWIDIEERPGRHSVPYAIFRSGEGIEPPARLGGLDAKTARKLIRRMKRVSDIVLELAATVVFLRDQWHYYGKTKGDPAEETRAAVEETKARKPLKGTDERMAKARDLLLDLGLWERAAPATP